MCQAELRFVRVAITLTKTIKASDDWTERTGENTGLEIRVVGTSLRSSWKPMSQIISILSLQMTKWSCTSLWSCCENVWVKKKYTDVFEQNLFLKIAGQQIGLLIGTWVGENTLFFRSLVWSMVQNDAIRTNLSKQMLSENWNISGRAVLIIFICLLLCRSNQKTMFYLRRPPDAPLVPNWRQQSVVVPLCSVSIQ